MDEPLLTKNVPRHIQKCVLETKLKLWAETLSEVNLIDEFLEYCESIEYIDNDNIEDILHDFALKWPGKLYSVPKEQRHSKWIVINEVD